MPSSDHQLEERPIGTRSGSKSEVARTSTTALRSMPTPRLAMDQIADGEPRDGYVRPLLCFAQKSNPDIWRLAHRTSPPTASTFR